MSKKNTSSKNSATHLLTPPVTNFDKIPPYIVLDAKLRDFTIFKNNNILGLFYDLVVHAPAYTRIEYWDNDELTLAPRQGVFAGRIFAPRMKLSRSTVWRYLRLLEKHKFMKRTLQHSYSIYTLTGKGLIDFSKYPRNTVDNTRGTPPATPRGTHSHQSIVKSNIVKETKQVNREDYRILLSRKDHANACKQIINNYSCSRSDHGLKADLFKWLLAGVCAAYNGNCKNNEAACKVSLKILATRMHGRSVPHPKAYVEKSVNQFFHPDLFQELIPEGSE